jgi:very-short-patch-repair endonuclease
LVVETDSLRYHRTPAKQATDNRRDHAHIAAGHMPLRFTHWQVRYEANHVRKLLALAARHREGRG